MPRSGALGYKVLLTDGAARDLESIYDYIADFDAPAKADYVLDRLMEAVEGLTRHPERGSHPRELGGLGIHEYRQIFFKPYRVIYRVIESDVVIYLVADSRRDLQSLLARRLLGS